MNAELRPGHRKVQTGYRGLFGPQNHQDRFVSNIEIYAAYRQSPFLYASAIVFWSEFVEY
jgi:hypothetical protein